MSRRAIALLSEYRETNIYLRGVVPLLGLNSAEVYYTRKERRAGQSKYKLKNMFSLSVAGVTSFSIMPLRIISIVGLLVFVISFPLGGWALVLCRDRQNHRYCRLGLHCNPDISVGRTTTGPWCSWRIHGKTYMEVKNAPCTRLRKPPTNDNHTGLVPIATNCNRGDGGAHVKQSRRSQATLSPRASWHLE